MDYKVQVMDKDFNTVEFSVEEQSSEEAITTALEGIDRNDVLLIAVFEGGSNISLPITPVDSIVIKRSKP